MTLQLTYRHFILPICILFYAIDIASQDYVFDHYHVKEELVSDELYGCVADHEGFLWLATEAGLFTYDGIDFTHITPAGGPKYQSVYEVHLDPQGELWFYGSDGRVRMIGLDGEQRLLATQDSAATAFKMGFCSSGDGRKWIGSLREGLFEYDPELDLVSNVFTDLYVSDIYPTSQGLLIVSSQHLIVYDLENRSADTIFTYEDAYLTRSTLSDHLLYVAGAENLYTIDLVDFQLVDRYSLPSGLQVIHLSIDQSGDLILGTRTGLYLLDTAGGTIKPHSFSKQLNNKGVSYYQEDDVGNVWITTLDNGLYRFYKPTITKVETVTLQPVKNLQSSAKQRQLVIGGLKGRYAIVDSTNTIVQKEVVWKHDGEVIGSIIDSTLEWVITDNNITLVNADTTYRIVFPCRRYHYDASTNELFIVYLAGLFKITPFQLKQLAGLNHIESFMRRTQSPDMNLFEGDTKDIAATADGRKWFVGNYGLASYKDKVEDYNHHQLLRQPLRNICNAGPHLLYLSTLDEDILAYDTQQDTVWRYLSGEQRCGRFIRDMAVDTEDNLWIAHNKGVSRIHPTTHNVVCYDAEDGLPITKINAILPNDSIVLLGTDLGLYQLDIHDRISDRVATLSISDLTVPYEVGVDGDFILREKKAYLNLKPKAIGYGRDLTYRYRINPQSDYIPTSDKKIPLDRLRYGDNVVDIELADRHGLIIADLKVQILLLRPWYLKPLLLIPLSILLLVLLYTGIMKRLVDRIKNHITERLRRLQPPPLKLTLKLTDGSYQQLLIDDIDYMKSAGNYIEVYTQNHKLLTRMTMSVMTSAVEHATPLKQIHRSYIVNTSKISSIDHRHIHMQELIVPYSTTYKKVIDPLKVKLQLNRSLA